MILRDIHQKITLKIKEAAPYKHPLHLIIDIIFHKLYINTDPRDYFLYKFYLNDKSMKEKSRFTSLRGSRYFPHGNNSLKYNIIFTNKLIQKAIFHFFKLPTPELLTTIGDNYEIREQSQLNNFLTAIERDIVIKQISGTHGDGFLSLSRKGEQFFVGDKLFTNQMIWDHMREGFSKGYLVEEKVTNSNQIYSIYPDSLNTFRVVMIKTNDNKWNQACCYLRLGQQGKHVDNLCAGGVFALVGSEGKTIAAYDARTSQALNTHPDTGNRLIDIEFDSYKDVVELARNASEKFHFMGSIGWDIAATDKGPLIIEANAWWGDHQRYSRIAIISDEMANGLKKRNMFSRWDKSKMYPGFYKETFFKRFCSKLF
jgi:hypothetical protein